MSSSRQPSPSRPARLARRSLLAAAAGSIGLLTRAVASPPTAQAANGDPLILARLNSATATTILRTVHRGLTTLRIVASGRTSIALEARSPNNAVFADGGDEGTGVHAQSVFGDAVNGMSLFGTGLHGSSGHGRGVVGESDESDAVSGSSRFGSGLVGANISKDRAAVVGWAQNRSTGVQGIVADVDSQPPAATNTGVHGVGHASGATGVLAESSAGTALRVNGAAVFSRSGVVTLSPGSDSAVQAGVPLGPSSSVLAVLRSHHRGLHVEAAVPDARSDSFTVFLNRRVNAPAEVAWFVVN